jgi:serine/threonine-protein phosphatase 4 regulatory subunit 1
MQDKNKKVKINAFKFLGRFLETLQNLDISQEFLELFTETGLKTKNKELQFYCAYNIPGILYILKGDSWSTLEELYIKLSKSTDARIKKTLAYSIHEIAKLVGEKTSEELLIKFLNQYLKDGLKEVKSGVITHLHEFCSVISSKERLQFLKIYLDADKEKTMVDMYAENIGDFSLLFPPKEVTKSLLPLFFNLCQSRLAHVRKLTAQNLAKMLEVYKEDEKMQEEIIVSIQSKF